MSSKSGIVAFLFRPTEADRHKVSKGKRERHVDIRRRVGLTISLGFLRKTKRLHVKLLVVLSYQLCILIMLLCASLVLAFVE